MTDQSQPPADATPPPALPEVASISDAAIARWSGFNPTEPLLLPVNKQMLDHLMVALRNGVVANIELGNTIQAFSFNDLKVANEHFIRHQGMSRHALSGFNQFIETVMQNVQREGSDGQ